MESKKERPTFYIQSGINRVLDMHGERFQTLPITMPGLLADFGTWCREGVSVLLQLFYTGLCST